MRRRTTHRLSVSGEEQTYTHNQIGPGLPVSSVLWGPALRPWRHATPVRHGQRIGINTTTLRGENKPMSITSVITQIPATKEPVSSDDQIAQILTICNERPKLIDLCVAVKIIANTAISPQELAMMHWNAVEVTNSRILIETVARPGAYRYMPCGPRTLEAFVWLRERRPGSGLVLGSDAKLLLRSLQAQLRDVGREIGFKAGFRAIRVRAIERFFALGVDRRAICRCLGYPRKAQSILWLNPNVACDTVAKHLSDIAEF